jgi:hypothetical protein
MAPTVSLSTGSPIHSKMNTVNTASNATEQQVVSADLASKSHYHNEGRYT